MRIAVLSDVHGNLEALEAVVDAARASGVGTVVCLGDVVGYGPDPVACVEAVGREADAWVAGNHDLAALPANRGLRRLFRDDARVALDWTESCLDGQSVLALSSLPHRAEGPWGIAAHGTLDDPMSYVFTLAEAAEQLDRAAPVSPVWLGHTHVPLVVHRPAHRGSSPGASGPRTVRVVYDIPVDLAPGRWLFNPGSVGQPRDGDPRARWALLDVAGSQVTLRATEYDFRETQRKMRAVGLPPGLIMLLGP